LFCHNQLVDLNVVFVNSFGCFVLIISEKIINLLAQTVLFEETKLLNGSKPCNHCAFAFTSRCTELDE
tara:strand:- start:418 stop:621 length:204 start_codon:yes stop_codon:yes gene_type:complete